MPESGPAFFSPSTNLKESPLPNLDHLLVMDELGYVPMARQGGHFLFHLIRKGVHCQSSMTSSISFISVYKVINKRKPLSSTIKFDFILSFHLLKLFQSKFIIKLILSIQAAFFCVS